MIGNEAKKQRLYHLAKEKKLSHATLLSGPKGVGKFLFWKELACSLLNTDRPLPPHLVMVDDLYLDGQTKEGGIVSSSFDQSHRKKDKKKTDTIGVEDIESFTKHLYETVEGDYKIVIIRDIERMTREASNHFLKVLEEPPVKTLFLMTTSEESRILPTIFSRVQKETFSLISDAVLQEHIPASFSDQDAQMLLALSMGRSEDFFRFLRDDNAFLEAKKQFEFHTSLQNISFKEVFALADTLSKEASGVLADFLDTHLCMLRADVVRCLHASSVSDFASLVARFHLAYASRSDVLANGNKKLVLENFLLRGRGHSFTR